MWLAANISNKLLLLLHKAQGLVAVRCSFFDIRKKMNHCMSILEELLQLSLLCKKPR